MFFLGLTIRFSLRNVEAHLARWWWEKTCVLLALAGSLIYATDGPSAHGLVRSMSSRLSEFEASEAGGAYAESTLAASYRSLMFMTATHLLFYLFLAYSILTDSGQRPPTRYSILALSATAALYSGAPSPNLERPDGIFLGVLGILVGAVLARRTEVAS